MSPRNKNEHGIALILVMWILVLLIALGTEFALSMKTEIDTTRNFKEDAETRFLAKAGIQLAQAEILADVQYHSWTEKDGFIFGPPVLKNQAGKEKDDSEEASEIPEAPVRKEIPLGSGWIQYTLRDENGKININTASREILDRALAANGLPPGSEKDSIADSILDWIDNDDRRRVNGAESEFYKGLSPGYSAKNGPLDSLEELLKIKGITPELFYGSEEYDSQKSNGLDNAPGLARIFTVQGVSQFNPNTAERAVLEIMYPESEVGEILSKKEERGWYNQSKSTHFKIEATGTLEHSPTRHTVAAVIEKRNAGDQATLVTRYWNDNLIRR